MAIIDPSMVFSRGQSVTALDADVFSDLFVDMAPQLSKGKPFLVDVGEGWTSRIRIEVVSSFHGNGSLQPFLRSDDDPEFTSMKMYELGKSTPLSELRQGKVFNLELPKRGLQRYIQLVYRIHGESTYGTISSRFGDLAPQP